MVTTENEQDTDLEKNKTLVRNLVKRDGKLVAPIDLSLDTTHPFYLDALKWVHMDSPPYKMKLTNNGQTVLISGKWQTQRPYLTGGPLDGSYVFAQMHFHWGSDEHEGSEHTVRGICYPMEIHVVFFKSRYLTQEAALKQEDGIVIVVYLVKLQSSSTAILKNLASQLENVMQSNTSAALPLCPLSALLIPFTKDYLLYWGCMSTQRCSHTLLWLISRASLSITMGDLTKFRRLLNSSSEPITKNFRSGNSTDIRTVIHVNPSMDKSHLLLPGTMEPPGQSLLVNFMKMPVLAETQAKMIFSRGDSGENDSKSSIIEMKPKLSQSSIIEMKPKLSQVTSSAETVICCAEDQVLKVQEMKPRAKSLQRENSVLKSVSNRSHSYVGSDSSRGQCLKVPTLHLTKSEKKKCVAKRKLLEKERREELEKNKIKGVKTSERKGNAQKKKGFKTAVIRNTVTEKCGRPDSEWKQPSNQSIVQQSPAKQVAKKEAGDEGHCVHLIMSPVSNSVNTETEDINTAAQQLSGSEKPVLKSKLPVRRQQSTLKSLFSGSAKQDCKVLTGSTNVETVASIQTESKDKQIKPLKRPVSVQRNKVPIEPSSVRAESTTQTVTNPKATQDLQGKSLKTTIPRPIGRNSGKLESNLQSKTGWPERNSRPRDPLN